jgi:hypothetical protein
LIFLSKSPGTPVSSTNKTGRIKLTVTKQEVYCFVSTVGNTSYLTTSTLITKYIWAVLIKLHDSHCATYDDRRKSYRVGLVQSRPHHHLIEN